MREISTINENIGQNLSRVRNSRSLSLDKLSGLSGVSKGMLVRIEQAKTNPSVGTLCKIANALGVPITSFLEEKNTPEVQILDPSAATPLWKGEHGGYGSIVAGSDIPTLTEFWVWLIYPGEKHTGLAHPPGTKEILFIQTGELTLRVNTVDYKAKAGETIVFVADVPHQYENSGSETLSVLMITCEPK